ncbi:MAG: hypothetical protein R6U19_01620 [Bacteroidales bacterium]
MIAIHHRPGSYSERWIEYCEDNNISYKLVNCFDNTIFEQLEGCNGLMWHWHHNAGYRAYLFARQLTYALEAKGIKVFPDSKTAWHFDDKLGQKYLFEAMRLSIVPTYVFYDKEKAMKWVETACFPKVFKTRNGSGSKNVSLVKSKKQAKTIIRKCFGKGIPNYSKQTHLKESLWKFRRNKDLKSFGRILKYLLKLPLPLQFQPDHVVEKNYAYFQDFVPNTNCDYRLKVIGNRCFGKKRYVRTNDFRASGSGMLDSNYENIPRELVEYSFQAARMLKLQCIAFDYIYDKDQFYLLEMSYAYAYQGENISSFWDPDLNRIKGNFIPEYFMIQEFLNEIDQAARGG